jgi:carbamoyl-phosphate synthase large subunit
VRAAAIIAWKSSKFACDSSTDAPALQKADKAFIVPRVDQEDYIDTLLAICDDHQIGMPVPALEPELLLVTMNRARFFAIGTIPLVSPPEITATSCDKLATSNFLSKCGLLAPQTFDSLAAAMTDARDADGKLKPTPSECLQWGASSV